MSTNKKLQHYAQRPGLIDDNGPNLSIIVDGFADCELEDEEDRYAHQTALLYLLRDIPNAKNVTAESRPVVGTRKRSSLCAGCS